MGSQFRALIIKNECGFSAPPVSHVLLDVCFARNVHFVPEPTYAAQQIARLFDHLVGDGEQPWRKTEAEYSGGVEVDHELEFGRLDDR